MEAELLIGWQKERAELKQEVNQLQNKLSDTRAERDEFKTRSNALMERLEEALRPSLTEDQSIRWRRSLREANEREARQALLVHRLQNKVREYMDRCQHLDLHTEQIKADLSASLESALIRLEEEQQRSLSLSHTNMLVHEQLSQSEQANSTLREDLQKLTADWTRAVEEAEQRKDDWKKEREAQSSVAKQQHAGLLSLWRSVLDLKSHCHWLKTSADRDLWQLRAELARFSSSLFSDWVSSTLRPCLSSTMGPCPSSPSLDQDQDSLGHFSLEELKDQQMSELQNLHESEVLRLENRRWQELMLSGFRTMSFDFRVMELSHPLQEAEQRLGDTENSLRAVSQAVLRLSRVQGCSVSSEDIVRLDLSSLLSVLLHTESSLCRTYRELQGAELLVRQLTEEKDAVQLKVIHLEEHNQQLSTHAQHTQQELTHALQLLSREQVVCVSLSQQVSQREEELQRNKEKQAEQIQELQADAHSRAEAEVLHMVEVSETRSELLSLQVALHREQGDRRRGAEEVDEARDALHKVEGEVHTLRSEVRSLLRLIQTLNLQLNQISDQGAEPEAELHQLKDSEGLKEELRCVFGHWSQLSCRVVSLQKIKGTLEGEVVCLQQDVVRRKEESRAEQEAWSQREELCSNRWTCSKPAAELSRCQSEIYGLREEVQKEQRSRERDVSTLKEEVQKDNQEREEELRRRWTEIYGLREELKKKQEAKEEELRRCRTEIYELRKEVQRKERMEKEEQTREQEVQKERIEEKLMRAEEEVVSLKEEMMRKERKEKEVQEELMKEREEVQKKQVEKEQIAEELVRAEEELKTLTEQVQNQQQELSRCQSEIYGLREEVQKEQEKKERIGEKLLGVEEELMTLRKELLDKQEKEQELRRCVIEIYELREEVQKEHVEKEQIAEELVRAEEELKTLTEQVQNQQQELSRCQSEIYGLREEVQKEQRSRERDVSTLKEEVQKDNQEREEELRRRWTEIYRLKEELQKKQEAKEEELRRCRTEIYELRKEVQRKERMEKEEQTREQEVQKERIEEKLMRAEEEVVSLKEKMMRKERKEKEVQEELMKEREEVQKKQEGNEELKSRVSLLREEVQKEHVEKEQIAEELVRAEEELKTLTEQVQNQQQELSRVSERSYRKKQEAKEEELRRCRTEIYELRKEVQRKERMEKEEEEVQNEHVEKEHIAEELVGAEEELKTLTEQVQNQQQELRNKRRRRVTALQEQEKKKEELGGGQETPQEPAPLCEGEVLLHHVATLELGTEGIEREKPTPEDQRLTLRRTLREVEGQRLRLKQQLTEPSRSQDEEHLRTRVVELENQLLQIRLSLAVDQHQKEEFIQQSSRNSQWLLSVRSDLSDSLATVTRCTASSVLASETQRLDRSQREEELRLSTQQTVFV
ncbi:golgin subfamily A member 6-like protein 22 [Gouania willdenowi]|uniref:golgin subfamily A member 6-like protein 22 n=1 Tax=Gouania willdenowi TaxID=441366 RepID=UPI001055A276|nr:golgin subfamily A member 6-like protein 22 [Gouania willdenowi]